MNGILKIGFILGFLYRFIIKYIYGGEHDGSNP